MYATDNFRMIFYKYLHKTAYHCGLEYLDPQYKVSLRTARYISLILLFWLAEIYTCLTKDMESILKSLSMVTTSFQGAYKVYMFFYRMQEMRLLVEYLHHFYKQCGRNSTASEICSLWSDRFVMLMKSMGGLLAVVSLIFLLFPIVGYVFFDHLEPILPIYFPVLSEDTSTGFMGLASIHTILVLATVVGLFCADLTVFLLVLHVCPMSEVFCSKMTELEGKLGTTDRIYGQEVIWYLSNTFSLHQTLSVYMTKVSEMFYGLFILEILLDGVSMCLIMFALLQFDWFPLYFLYMLYLNKLFVSCALGTMVEVYFDRILDGLQQFKWYSLKCNDQRMFMLMLLRAQNQSLLVVGTTPLNMELFVSVMKSTYTFAMCLLSMI